MTSRLSLTPRLPTGLPCVPRPSARGSASGRYWPVPYPRFLSPADSYRALTDPHPVRLLAASCHSRGVVIVALTGRAPALLLLGMIAVVLQPTMATVWIWWLVTACAIGLDLLLAPSPGKLVISRDRVHQVRLGVSGSTTLWLTHPTPRRLATFRGGGRRAACGHCPWR